MSEYIVSARKYRPQTFDTVVGQEHITTTLKNAIRNQHLAHAYLFCGPRGVGKTTCARILAKTINCESPTADMEACGQCSTCVSFKDNTSFNVFELDAASNNSVDDIRELIAQVRFAPQHGKYKIYIIDEVHMLSASAFNAFLKTLEEPPPYAIFILATTEKHKILPTILSRCQIFDFKRITTNDIVVHLQSIAARESMIANEAALHVIAQKSEGCMRDALSMLDRIASFTNGMLTYANTMEHLNLLDADYYFRITDAMLAQDVAGSLMMLDSALEKGFEGDVIIGGLAGHFRNLMLCKDARMAKLLDVPSEHKPVYYEKANQAPPSFIVSALNLLNQCEIEYRNATNRRLHVELCIIRLCFLMQFTKPQTMVPGEGGEKKNLDSLSSINFNTAPPASFAPATQATQAINAVPAQPPAATISQPATPVATPSAPTPVHSTPVAAQPVPTAPQPSPAPTPSQAATPPTRKVSLNMLGDLDADINAAVAARAAQQAEITFEVASDILEKYKTHLRAKDQSVILGQLALMKMEVYPPDEVRLISPGDLTDNYAKDQRGDLIDFFMKEAKMRVRVTTEVREDKSLTEPANRVLSKNEMFEVMANRNPNLARLRDGMGLQIEY